MRYSIEKYVLVCPSGVHGSPEGDVDTPVCMRPLRDSVEPVRLGCTSHHDHIA
jgi:hypothetical protein